MSSEHLPESTWSEEVASDPKHRPQRPNRPSTTVRREWCRRPQEAHLVDGDRYRRLSVAEIAVIQGFDPSWVDVAGIRENDRIAALGNAVPPQLSSVLAASIARHHKFAAPTFIEICAGIGGLSHGFDYLRPIALIEMWDVACSILRTGKTWDPAVVFEGRVEDFDFGAHKGAVGLLCGGPPCQPWSRAGKRRGAADPRDVMGATPSIVATCEPEIFLFENVPGLVTSKEHGSYLEDLMRRLGEPRKGLRYGVAVGILNAADFGLPQTRKRVFFVGVRDGSSKLAGNILRVADSLATHHDPGKPAVGKKPWMTLREAFAGIPETEQWRRYNARASEGNEFIVDANGEPDVNGTAVASEPFGPPPRAAAEPVHKITFRWPGEEERVRFEDGKWRFEPRPDMGQRRGLIYESSIGSGDSPGGMVVVGDYADGLEALAPFLRGTAKLVYYDSHRRDVLEGESEAGLADSTWLSLVRDIASAAHRCLSRTGVFVLQADEESAHYGRIVLDEVFGRGHHVTTFAWQKKYGPQNDLNTPTDAFDYLIAYSKCHRDQLPKIGLLERPDDIIDEGDFRGCFTAGHKGARSGSERTKFEVNAPPYRWEVLESNSPPGDHWFDKVSGVIWYPRIDTAGMFWLRVRVSDSAGATAEGRIEFTVEEKARPAENFEIPDRIWWLLTSDNDIESGGPLRVETGGTPRGLRGEPFSLVLKAAGGDPFAGRTKAPGTGRFWEFSDDTLVEAVAKAEVYWGTRGTALPSIKHYHDRDNAVVKKAVLNWLPWQDYGKSEDATRHLRSLADKGIIDPNPEAIAKPEMLLHHLVRLFAPEPGDVLVGLGDRSASMAAVGLKTGRFSVHLTGPSPEDLARWEGTGKRRLEAVLSRVDDGGINALEGFEQSEPGPVGIYSVSDIVLESDASGSIVRVEAGGSADSISDFYAALVGCSRQWGAPPCYGGPFGTAAFVLEQGDILDHVLLSMVVQEYGSSGRVYVIYERAEIAEDERLPPGVQILHAPYELTVGTTI